MRVKGHPPERMVFVSFNIDYVKVITEKAVLVIKDDAEFWIPRSVLSKNSDQSLEVGDVSGILEIHDWFIEKQGW
jgi:hypothetical protein